MAQMTVLLRRQLPGFLALVLMAGLFQVARLPAASDMELDNLASRYAFESSTISMPGGFEQQTIRQVNQAYEHIDAWISSVGAGIAMNDLDGDGLANDLCVTDPRIDQVVVTPVPDARADRYEPFALDLEALPASPTMAPMGCVPGDFNEDGRMDLLVYLWGRTPIAYLARSDVTELRPDAYHAVDLVPGPGGSRYNGPLWNTNAVAVDDFDGDGHVDIFVGNYFPHSPVLDSTQDSGVAMNRSLSAAYNGGEDYFLRWTGAETGSEPTVTFELVGDVLERDVSKGWVLAAAANDLDSDGRPELYLAHDFGPDRLLYNESVSGELSFRRVEGASDPFVPKSKRLGHDSFKGMGADFGDLNGDGQYDLFVSNITTSFGLEESHFAFVNTGAGAEETRAKFQQGQAPFQDRSAPMGLAWSGWGWDVKLADFDNSGETAVVQATGFVKGEVNRWPQLQEMAMSNDGLLEHPLFWPRITAGDDIGGNQRLFFFVKDADGRYHNVAGRLGLAVPVPTRGLATGDADGDGRLDFAVARQWDAPVFYQNRSPSAGAYLNLRLVHPDAGAPPETGSPVVGAQVTVTTADGRRLIGRVDGGSGHGGKRSHEVHIGLGRGVDGPVQVHLRWRARDGQVHEQELPLEPGQHTIELDTQAQVR